MNLAKVLHGRMVCIAGVVEEGVGPEEALTDAGSEKWAAVGKRGGSRSLGFESKKPSKLSFDVPGYLDFAANPFEFLHKYRYLLIDVPFPGQVIRIQRAHLWQNGIQLSSIFTCKFAS